MLGKRTALAVAYANNRNTPAQVHAYSITLFHPYSLEFTSKTIGVGRRKWEGAEEREVRTVGQWQW